MQLTPVQEASYFKGNALRNCGKLQRSGIIAKIIKYCSREDPNKKPLELEIPHGNPEDAYVLLESIAAQQQRKELQEKNKLPKGHTRPRKLGVRNYAFHKGCNPMDAASCIFRKGNNIIISPLGAELINGFVEENKEYFEDNLF